MKLILFIILIGVNVFANIAPYQTQLLNSLSLNNYNIIYYSRVLDDFKNHSLVPSAGNENLIKSPHEIDKEKIAILVSDLDFLKNLIGKNKSKTILEYKDQEKKLIMELGDNILNTHRQKIKTYNSYYVDKTFFSQNILNISQFMPNYDGIWVTNDGTRYLHALTAHQYLAPSNRIGKVRDPYNELKNVNSTLCMDARYIYEDEWAKYIQTSNVKDNLLNEIYNFQRNDINDKVKKHYSEQKMELMEKINHLYANKIYYDNQYQMVTDRIIQSGVKISGSKSFENIYKSVEKFGRTLENKYSSFLKYKKQKKYSNAAYEIFSLVYMDVKKTHEEAQKEGLRFLRKKSKNILKDWKNNQIYTLDKINTMPFSNADYIVLATLANENFGSSLYTDSLDKEQLPFIKTSIINMISILEKNNLNIIKSSKLINLTEVNTNVIENIYLSQFEKNNIKLASTDNHEIKGLLIGDKLLTMADKSLKFVNITNKISENWGVKSYKIDLKNIDDQLFSGYLNIRITDYE